MYVHYDVSFLMITLDSMNYMLELFDLPYAFECLILNYVGTGTTRRGGSNSIFPSNWSFYIYFQT